MESMESTFVLWFANKSDGGLGSIVELQFTQGKFTNLDRTTRLQYVELGPSPSFLATEWFKNTSN